MLQYIFVSLVTCLENRIVFALLGTFDRDLGDWLEDYYGTCLVCLIQISLVLLMVGSESIYPSLCGVILNSRPLTIT